jgi:hypothetical protein
MPIPTHFDYQLVAIDDLHGCVLGRLRTYHRAGPDRDPAAIREALKAYVDAVSETVDAEHR